MSGYTNKQVKTNNKYNNLITQDADITDSSDEFIINKNDFIQMQ